MHTLWLALLIVGAVLAAAAVTLTLLWTRYRPRVPAPSRPGTHRATPPPVAFEPARVPRATLALSTLHFGRAVALSRNDTTCAVLDGEGHVHVFEGARFRRTAPRRARVTAPGAAPQVDPCGQWVALLDVDGHLAAWDWRENTVEALGAARAFAWTREGALLVTVAQPPHGWRVDAWTPPRTHRHWRERRSLARGDDAAGGGHVACVWDGVDDWVTVTEPGRTRAQVYRLTPQGVLEPHGVLQGPAATSVAYVACATGHWGLLGQPARDAVWPFRWAPTNRAYLLAAESLQGDAGFGQHLCVNGDASRVVVGGHTTHKILDADAGDWSVIDRGEAGAVACGYAHWVTGQPVDQTVTVF